MQKRLRNRWLTNLALLGVIGLLGLLLWLGEEKPPAEKPRLSQYLPVDVAQMRIERQGKQTVRFERRDHEWYMLEPYQVPADNLRMRDLLSLAELEISAEIDAGESELAGFGLQAPRMVIEMNDRAVAFGDTQPIGNRRYLMIGQRVLLVADEHFKKINTSSISFIDRHIVPKGGQLQTLSIGERRIEKTGAGWQDSEDGKEVDVLIDAWQDSKASWLNVARADEADGIPVEIILTGGESPLKYLAQQRETGLVLIRPDLQLEYHMLAGVAARLGLAKDEPETPQAGADPEP